MPSVRNHTGGYTMRPAEVAGSQAVVAVQFPGESEDMNFVVVQGDDGWRVSLAFTLARGMTMNVQESVSALGSNASPEQIAEAMRAAMQGR